MHRSVRDRVEATRNDRVVCIQCDGLEIDDDGVNCTHCDGSGFEPIAETGDVTALWKAVSKEVVDDTAKSALADALAEAGDFDTASVIDWCIKRKRWPKLRTSKWGSKKKEWTWAPSSVSDAPKSVGNGLPRPIHEFVEHYHNTLREAIESLRDGLIALRELGPKWRN